VTTVNSVRDLHVLLVEPSTTQAHLVQRMLENAGVASVDIVSSGADALAVLAQEVPGRVLISSLYLPDMAGTDLVEALRLDVRHTALPFLLISSETRPQRLEGVRQSGACMILRKPFTPDELARALNAAVDYLNPPAELDIEEIEALRVLVVDDSFASRQHLQRLLKSLGIEQIMLCNNGKEAVAILGESMVDLVITDYNMPEMDGAALVDYIRKQSWQSDVPVLLVTSEQNKGRLAAVERAGVSAICDKPFDAASIRRLISDALR